MLTKTEMLSYGVRALRSPHPEIRKLKRHYPSSVHGNKIWASSWLLMDYFKRRGLAQGARVMELGCGWGLTGIYCAKNHGAIVTGVDTDPDVFPYLQMHADLNKVKITTLIKPFEKLKTEELMNVDVLIGADICFWKSMVDALTKSLRRAIRSEVPLILIADPGREPFEKMGETFIKSQKGEVLDWSVKRPREIQGQILKIGKWERRSDK
ncbi:MAG: methyltransferase domain-containing protein [Nitrospira sp.]|nr:methyltransferase domain-containing protein [Candidatus Manganitrophaceae bacterium]HIL33939.1 methyltransferase domain-containing protein [Candidatus Manganitrophaceae bacterium]